MIDIPQTTEVSFRDLCKILERTYGGTIEVTHEDYREGAYIEQKVIQTKADGSKLVLFRYLNNPKHNQIKVLMKNLIYDYVESLETGSIRYMGNC